MCDRKKELELLVFVYKNVLFNNVIFKVKFYLSI